MNMLLRRAVRMGSYGPFMGRAMMSAEAAPVVFFFFFYFSFFFYSVVPTTHIIHLDSK